MYLRVRAEIDVSEEVIGTENTVTFDVVRVNRYLKELTTVVISPSGIIVDKKRKSIKQNRRV